MILVTGASGYLGSNMVVKLESEGYNVIGLDIKPAEHLTCKFYPMNMLDLKDLETIFNDNKIDLVIHFAAYKSVKESVNNPGKYYNNNINILTNLLYCMQKYHCDKLVFSSSATVYGNQVCPMNELTPHGTSTNPYGTTKQICEQIIEDYCKHSTLRAISLRYFNPVGKSTYEENAPCPAENLVPNILHALKGNLTLQIFGTDYDTIDGTCERDFIHINDLMDGHLRAMEYIDTNPGYETFNLGTGNPCTVLSLIKVFERVFDKKIPYELHSRRPGDIQTSYCCNKKAKEKLLWSPTRTIEDMCTSYVV